jgi:hypothetical protein
MLITVSSFQLDHMSGGRGYAALYILFSPSAKMYTL